MKTPRRSTKEKFPVRVSVGGVTVKIYSVRTGVDGAYETFAVADYADGKRRLRKFARIEDAKAEAHRLAVQLSNRQHDAASLTNADAAELRKLRDTLAPLGIDPVAAAAILTEAAGLVGVHRVVEACAQFARHNPAGFERVLISNAADTYLKAKEAKGRSRRLLQDIRSRVGRFVHDNPGAVLQDFTTGRVQTWLDGLKRLDEEPVSAMTRRNFAAVLSGFFEHFRKRGIIADNPCGDLEREGRAKGGAVEFWTPEEACKLLESAPKVTLPALVLGMLCGLRTAEITRIRWRHINFDAGHVEVGADIAKTASRRLVPLCPSAAALLKPRKGKPEAPVYSEHPTTLPKRVSETCEAAGVRRIPNGARHSWVTYRVAFTGDVSRVALEAGNSPTVVHQHYRGLATAEQAKKFFDIMPT